MSRVTRKPASLRRPVGYHDLLADLKHPGCAVCRGSDRGAWNRIDSILWEMVNDPGVRAGLRAAHGFCREHALMAVRVSQAQSAALGMAIMYEDFLRHAREQAIAAIRERARGPRRTTARSRKTGVLVPHASCPACESAEGVASNYLAILADAGPDSEVGRAARRPHPILCVRHLREGLQLVASLEGAERLVELYVHGEEALRRDLLEFIRKHDYRFRSEGFTRSEGASWLRAVYTLVGEPPPAKRPDR